MRICYLCNVERYPTEGKKIWKAGSSHHLEPNYHRTQPRTFRAEICASRMSQRQVRSVQDGGKQQTTSDWRRFLGNADK